MEFNANSNSKKLQLFELFGKNLPNKPFCVMYPRGNLKEKKLGKKIFDAFTSFEDMLNSINENKCHCMILAAQSRIALAAGSCFLRQPNLKLIPH